MKVVVIEDDPEIIEVVTIAFETAWPGSEVVAAYNGTDGVELVRSADPDVLLLDVGLPEGEAYGFQVCQQVRSFSNVPVIILTVRNREVDIVRGLELGASDYMTKPFSAMELMARTRAVLRRVQVSSLTSATPPYISRHLSVNFDTREVIVDGGAVKLTPTEYRLLCHLIRNANQVVSSQSLLAQVWGEGYTDSNDLVKAHIQRLRRKLGDNSQTPKLIFTERGRGYRFIGSEQGR